MDKYVNSFKRANPGLIIFIVDQSESMNTLYKDGRSFAEVAAGSINKSISELALRCTNGTQIKEVVFIAIITHGGFGNNNARLYRIDKINELFNSPLRVENRKKTIPLPDGEGEMIIFEIEFDLPIIIESRAEGKANLSEAFDLASNLIREWREREDNDCDYPREISMDPIPLIVNIAPGHLSYGADLVQRANRIKGIEMEDGNPMILNCVCTKNHLTDDFPLRNRDEISSYIPQEKIDGFKCSGYPDVTAQCKLTMYNFERIPEVINIITGFSIPCPGPHGYIR